MGVLGGEFLVVREVPEFSEEELLGVSGLSGTFGGFLVPRGGSSVVCYPLRFRRDVP